MTARTIAGLTAVILALTSCGGGRRAVEIDPDEAALTDRWNGTLSSPRGLAGVSDIRGQGWMAADAKDQERTRAGVEIRNAVPGGRHPWHIHRGQCGSDQGILGPTDAYKPLEVEQNGRAEATAVLPIEIPNSGSFFVNVHASSRNMSTIVACGNLAPPAR